MCVCVCRKTNIKMEWEGEGGAALIPFHTIRSPMTTDRSYHIYIFGMMHKTKYQYLRSIYDHDSITILFSYAVQVSAWYQKVRQRIKKLTFKYGSPATKRKRIPLPHPFRRRDLKINQNYPVSTTMYVMILPQFIYTGER